MPEEYESTLSQVFDSPDVPKVYANSFICSLTASDVTVVARRNDRDVLVLNMSYTAAKSFTQILTDAIEKLEDVTSQPILTTKEISNKLEELKSGSGED